MESSFQIKLYSKRYIKKKTIIKFNKSNCQSNIKASVTLIAKMD